MRKNILNAIFVVLAITFILGTTAAQAATKKKITVEQGSSVKLDNLKNATWKSSKSSVAAVSTSGSVKGVKAGTATVTAKSGSKVVTYTVTVKKKAETATLKVDKNTTGMSAEEAKVYKKLLAQKKVLPEGTFFDNSVSYRYKGGYITTGYGCSAFAFRLSDAAFGTKRARKHTNFTDLHVGDIVRIYNNTHSVIILKVVGNQVVVAEGNYDGAVHWGRVINISDIQMTGTYVMSRY